MTVMDYGCTILSIRVPDQQGEVDDIVLGYESLEGYLASPHYMGCVVGRYANRIAYGKFAIDGVEYQLTLNHEPHHLHGGHLGFSHQLWSAVPFENEKGEGIDFYYTSNDGEEGYPGNLNVRVRYFLNHDNTLIVHYLAESDVKTLFNPTQHTYFNLRGDGKSILNQGLMVNAHHYLTLRESKIPTGDIQTVQGSPFDFRKIKLIGTDLLSGHAQIGIAHGYDHTWVLAKQGEELSHAATLFDPVTGRQMEVHTTEPGLQVYTGNFLDEHSSGKMGVQYQPYAGVCLETQHFPDSPNRPNFPTTILNPGEQFQSTTIYKFEALRREE